MAGLVSFSPEVRAALSEKKPVVALESSPVVLSFPGSEGLDVQRDAESRVRAAGAIPALVAVMGGELRIGFTQEELEEFAEAGKQARKIAPRDIAPCLAAGGVGVTTIGATLAIAGLGGIRFMAASGLGGVHRGFAERPDISADLTELAATPAMLVASGFKSLLDVGATAEVLESLSVPVIGWRTDTVPLYYVGTGGPPVSARAETTADAALIAHHHWETAARPGGLLLGCPPAADLADVEALITEGVERARVDRVVGPEVTPYVLRYVHQHSGGATLEASKRLIVQTAELAAEVAVEYRAAGNGSP